VADQAPDMDSLAWRPDMDRLAVLFRSRLQASASVNVFTEDSSPSLDEAELAVDIIIGQVGARVGWDLPAVLFPAAASVVMYGAAADLEAGIYAEQTRSDMSARPHWQSRYDVALDQLAEAAERLREGEAPPGGGTGGGGSTPDDDEVPSAEGTPAAVMYPDAPFVSGAPW
jgi:hypothetical protein